MSKKIPLSLATFYFCPNCGVEATPPVSPVTHAGNATEAAKTENLDRCCTQCLHHWRVGTESELERAVLLMKQASLLFGQAFAVVPPDCQEASQSMKWLRSRADEVVEYTHFAIENVLPKVRNRLPRP